jgi:BirA family biotin operon repressor/biotin-[acetyl-CoA-carboxylase] ligase
MAIPNSAFRILEILERSGNAISGEAISNELGITRSAVWKNIKELRLMGYDIQSSQKEGYRLVHPSSKLLPYEIHTRNFTPLSSENGCDILITSLPRTRWASRS